MARARARVHYGDERYCPAGGRGVVSWRDAIRSLAELAGALGLSHCEERLVAAGDPASGERAAHLTEFAVRSILLATSRLVDRGCQAREIVHLWDAADVIRRAAATARSECRFAKGDDPDVGAPCAQLSWFEVGETPPNQCLRADPAPSESTVMNHMGENHR